MTNLCALSLSTPLTVPYSCTSATGNRASLEKIYGNSLIKMAENASKAKTETTGEMKVAWEATLTGTAACATAQQNHRTGAYANPLHTRVFFHQPGPVGLSLSILGVTSRHSPGRVRMHGSEDLPTAA